MRNFMPWVEILGGTVGSQLPQEDSGQFLQPMAHTYPDYYSHFK